MHLTFAHTSPVFEWHFFTVMNTFKHTSTFSQTSPLSHLCTCIYNLSTFIYLHLHFHSHVSPLSHPYPSTFIYICSRNINTFFFLSLLLIFVTIFTPLHIHFHAESSFLHIHLHFYSYAPPLSLTPPPSHKITSTSSQTVFTLYILLDTPALVPSSVLQSHSFTMTLSFFLSPSLSSSYPSCVPPLTWCLFFQTTPQTCKFHPAGREDSG